jgi:hypothetical protein
MSPLRRWFTEHHMPGWYSWVVVLGTSFMSLALSLLVSLQSAQRAVDAERAARVTQVQEQQRTNAEALRATCAVVIVQDGALNDPASPPLSAAGKRAAEAWHNLRLALHCD